MGEGITNGKENDSRAVRDARCEVRIECPDERLIRWSSMSMSMFIGYGIEMMWMSRETGLGVGVQSEERVDAAVGDEWYSRT
jgi:hypothetical protein